MTIGNDSNESYETKLGVYSYADTSRRMGVEHAVDVFANIISHQLPTQLLPVFKSIYFNKGMVDSITSKQYLIFNKFQPFRLRIFLARHQYISI
jgi:hypothetical protein